ncbi:sensor histidine kinase [Glycomyces arizonensis]|uniref:sensor histidine kinase n=1 Tax=Glycomyces arizonensis TaxID=256035 RepID=UPI00042A1809|nr:histidine kinase [Glycomyces arizonensis]
MNANAAPSARPGPVLSAAVAVAAFAATAALTAHGGVFPESPGSGRLDATAYALIAAATLPLACWRVLGVGTFAVTASAGIAMAAFEYPADLLIGPALALYLLTARRDRPLPGNAVALTTGAFVLYLAIAWIAEGGFPVSELLHTGLAWTTGWFAGERARLRRQHLSDLRQRAVRAECEAERERALAVAEERARVARDLHDSAGHAVSLIAVRAGAVRLSGDPARALETLAAVEDLARRTAEEIDRLVGSLRDTEGAERDPVGMDSLMALLAHHRAAGLHLELVVSGEPRALRPAADQAAYRIAQEALANASRHGTGTARLSIDWGPSTLALAVANHTGARRPERSSGGHGLIGMRERVGLLGGTVRTEEHGGDFLIRAEIPYGGGP